MTLACSYVLPLKADVVDQELADYLHRLAGDVADLVVVDGSDDEVFAEHGRRWPAAVRHLRLDPSKATPMGKVGNVLTGLAAARHDLVVIADDDVRWTRELLASAIDRLDGVDVVRPQNVFEPAPWHARWDTGRILLNRLVGGDWPGTLVVRGSALPDGYAGDALFENLELVRTVLAAGGHARLAADLVVPRRPPTTRHFLGQRVRQAYDEWARPWRLVLQLALLPAVVVGGRRAAAGLALASIAAAEAGRRRGGGTGSWGPTAALWAPAWLAERSLTSWLAVGARLRGGARYRDGRLPVAAHSLRELRRRNRLVTSVPGNGGA